MPHSSGARTVFVTDERYFWHEAMDRFGDDVEPGQSFENPHARRRLLNLLAKSGLRDQMRAVAPELMTRGDLLRVHAAEYVDRLKAQSDGSGGEAGEYTAFGHGSFEIACLSAGGAFAAIREVALSRASNAYALVRPPGHHAEADRGRGYCMLANIPLGIARARAELGLGRVAVIDWDVHHGNGTQWLFWDDPSVLSISLHQDRLYPAESGTTTEVGGPAARGGNVNVPLPPGSGRGAYLHAMDEVVAPAVRSFGPDLIVIACGFDAGGLDPMGRMQLSSATFAELTRSVLSLAADVCGGRVAVVQEGGYSPLHVPFCGAAMVAALLDVPPPVTDPFAWLDGHGGQDLLPHQAEAVAQARGAAAGSGAIAP